MVKALLLAALLAPPLAAILFAALLVRWFDRHEDLFETSFSVEEMHA